MPELRQDPLTGAWVILSPERALRPRNDANLDPLAKPKDPGPCPFCPGNESMTPRETFAIRPDGSAPDTPGWRVRCFPNSYPALMPQAPELAELALPINSDVAFQREKATGIHEVLVECAEHRRDWWDCTPEQIAETLEACRQRSLAIRAQGQAKQLVIFKNGGLAAGGSQVHPHMQLFGTPFVSWRVRDEFERAREWHERTGGCLMCEMRGRGADRLVGRFDDCMAFVPFAPRVPFETWIVSDRHEADFADIDGELGIRSLSRAIVAVMQRIARALNSPPYNVAIVTAPLDSAADDFFHWRIEIIPRLNNIGGFEWSAGGHLNSVMPEEAARRLRAASSME